MEGILPSRREALVVPGLNDTSFITSLTLRLLTWQWERWGVHVNVVPMRWEDTSETYDQKYARLCKAAEKLFVRQRERLIIMGISAGGSVAMRFGLENPEYVDLVMNNSGLLRRTTPKAEHTAEAAKTKYPAFEKSVQYYEQFEQTLSPSAFQNAIAFFPRYDELVPKESARLPYGREVEIFAYEHIWAILAANVSREMKGLLGVR